MNLLSPSTCIDFIIILLRILNLYKKVARSHVASVFLTYALVQLDMKKHRCKTPEEAIRRCKTKNVNSLMRRFLDQLSL